ncbi:hypothetical protein WICPIJ_000584 [Wickerhamomyces pijperi]|uniref:Uncharacterized protein n=1 Tax=Wickerhamomyces pijperi TaxID=599730 RepID=A0A9P8TRS1_WICPI|nr:hypothetical protein WICPIJ_000584 [Wickerhamomyces pijperi]
MSGGKVGSEHTIVTAEVRVEEQDGSDGCGAVHFQAGTETFNGFDLKLCDFADKGREFGLCFLNAVKGIVPFQCVRYICGCHG